MTVDSIGEALRSLIINNATVAAMTTRCYPGTLPQSPIYPLVLYWHVSGVIDNHLRGDSGMAHPRFQIESWASTYAAAKALSLAVREALNNYSGTVGTVRIGSCLIVGSTYQYESEIEIHRFMQDYSIWHDE